MYSILSGGHHEQLSRYQPLSSCTYWGKVKSNCPFLLQKRTPGTSYIDETLHTNIRECERRGIPYWLYAFLNRGDETVQTRFLVWKCKEWVENIL